MCLFSSLLSRYFILSTLILSSLHIAAQNDTITYVNISDSCRRFIILPDGKIFMPERCEDHIDFITSISVIGDVSYKGRAVYEKRSGSGCPLVAGEDICQLYLENTDICVHRISMIDKDSFIVITRLKSGVGIDCHYSGIGIYERQDKKGCFQPDPNEGSLEIIIENKKHNSQILLAMDQGYIEESNQMDTTRVYIKNGIFGKTTRRSNPEDLMSGKYHFYLVDVDSLGNLLQMPIPTIYAPVHSVYMPLEDRVKVMDKYRLLIGKSSYFISCHHFNPGRDRVVNKVFGEEIEGNVLSLTLYSVEEYLTD